MFSGPPSALRRLAKAARKCGYPQAAVTRASFGPLVVALPAPTTLPSDDSPFSCVAEWVFAHPKLNLGFIGNEAYPEPEKPK
jgi:hypothetical protein